MALDLGTATPEQITTELAKYSLDAQRLEYSQAIRRITADGQENWNGDKKHFEARLDYLRGCLNDVEAKIRAKRNKKKSAFKGVDVNFI